jgi:ABC-type polysaccharide/polyol phosphate transport system ATPase subunit
MASVVLDDVSLRFKFRQARRVTLKEFLVQGLFRTDKNPITEVPALSNISLALSDGDRIGIIGHNGAGKSTLLKLIAGVYPPTSGERTVQGRISSLFEIALGFELDASGYENISYRGYLQGETPQSLNSKIQAIADFTELKQYLDMPVRYYSAGMLVRLAFAIATAIEPEILLIDEVLSVGDLAFQQKARQRMDEMMEAARLMVMVSHDLDSLTRLCNRAIWMDKGRMVYTGAAADVAKQYTRCNGCYETWLHNNPNIRAA